jgi:hypothetical protein
VDSQWLSDKLIGAPMATDAHSVEDLRRMGVMGVYKKEQSAKEGQE